MSCMASRSTNDRIWFSRWKGSHRKPEDKQVSNSLWYEQLRGVHHLQVSSRYKKGWLLGFVSRIVRLTEIKCLY